MNHIIEEKHSWTIDTLKPVLKSIKTPDSIVSNKTGKILFNILDSNLAITKCRLNNNKYTTCVSPYKFNLINDGKHTFFLKAEDKAGNILDYKYSWIIDTVKPIINIVKFPSEYDIKKSGYIAFKL